MGGSAIGLVETRGLIGVIAAADSAAKSADVQIIGFEPVGDGLVSVRMKGDVASVQAAVQAAVEAAGRVSTVISHRVIAAPHEDLAGLLRPQQQAPGGAAIHPERDLPVDLDKLDEFPVVRLRQWVRQTPGARLVGRAVSRANKETLIRELRRLLGPDLH